jgi:hypothetical protein
MMSSPGWKQLLEDWPQWQGEGRFPILPCSEFMPPAYLVRRPYGTADEHLLSPDDPWGWPIDPYEEALHLRPGLEELARAVLRICQQVLGGTVGDELREHLLPGNPFWPPLLAEQAGRLAHERLVLLLPVALSGTKDDRGRLRWTLFGVSEQGPARAFWRSFYASPQEPLPTEHALDFFRQLLSTAYGEPSDRLNDLRQAGFRILPAGDHFPYPFWREDPLPSWVARYQWHEPEDLSAVKYLLTFRPFVHLPPAVQQAYLTGRLHLLPCPASLVFWGAQDYQRLARELPLALQIPLLFLLHRREAPWGLRIPQAGWLVEPLPDGTLPPRPGRRPRSTYHRTHRHQRLHRFTDPLTTAREDHLAHVLFGTAPHELGLYGKPMARNVQLWREDFHLLLDGPNASTEDLRRAADALAEGGWFGYRFLFPAMRVGRYELYWHRPLVACWSATTQEPRALPGLLSGYLTAYPAAQPDLTRPVELWPRWPQDEAHILNLRLFGRPQEEEKLSLLLNVRKWLHTADRLGQPLPESLAWRLLTGARRTTVTNWLDALPRHSSDPDAARQLLGELRRRLLPAPTPSRRRSPPPALTFVHTAKRSFEIAYWNLLATLSAGRYRNKNNADPALDQHTRAVRPPAERDLEPLGDFLLDYHRRSIARAGMTGQALAGALPFSWRTQYPFSWMGGWLANQQGRLQERNLLVVIPGRDRQRAVLLADHYDTAYMEDVYDRDRGGSGARLAAAGADDNASATATLLLAAPVFLQLSRAGRLACDVWLVHLTGEEFPAEGLGANHLCQSLVEGHLRLHLGPGQVCDLSGVRVQGIFVLDMIGHNSNQDRDVFQIAPGASREALLLAWQAHAAAETWNAWTPVWNRRPPRCHCGRGRRSPHRQPPPLARHLPLHGEIRPHYDPRSTLFNTDGQMFSDVGIPVVLFMENYDINRSGYHDTRDTLANINLDYAAALAAIAIETVARVASDWPLPGALSS